MVGETLDVQVSGLWFGSPSTKSLKPETRDQKPETLLEDDVPKSVKMMSDMNTTMMEVERVERVEDRLMVTGVMMGNFPTEIYLEPSDLLGLLVMHLRPSPLSFVLGLPYFWLRRYWCRPENSTLGARARGMAMSGALAIAGLCGTAAVVAGLIELTRLTGLLL